jgi:hypothetical protein
MLENSNCVSHQKESFAEYDLRTLCKKASLELYMNVKISERYSIFFIRKTRYETGNSNKSR